VVVEASRMSCSTLPVPNFQLMPSLELWNVSNGTNQLQRDHEQIFRIPLRHMKHQAKNKLRLMDSGSAADALRTAAKSFHNKAVYSRVAGRYLSYVHEAPAPRQGEERCDSEAAGSSICSTVGRPNIGSPTL